MSSTNPAPRITLLTDFGTRDGYVAAMRGVIAAIAPAARVEDATHDIPPGDVLLAAFTLERYWRLYPHGTVHVVVVDPGVGTIRRAIAAWVDGRILIAPDNGVLTLPLQAAERTEVFEIREPAFLHHPVSATFHGRDVFAPAAAHVAARVPPDALGPGIHDPVLLDLPTARVEEGNVLGEVLFSDRFGNAITSVPGDWVPAGATVAVDDHDPIPVVHTYGDAEPGSVLAVVGSTGRLEISVRDGSAMDRLGLARGRSVRLRAPG